VKRKFGTPNIINLDNWQELKASFIKREDMHTLAVLCLPQFGYFALRIEHQGGAYRAHPVEFALTLADAIEIAKRLGLGVAVKKEG
jgi:hypothetical protein